MNWYERKKVIAGKDFSDISRFEKNETCLEKNDCSKGEFARNENIMWSNLICVEF